MSKKNVEKISSGIILPNEVQIFVILWGHRFLCIDPNGHAVWGKVVCNTMCFVIHSSFQNPELTVSDSKFMSCGC